MPSAILGPVLGSVAGGLVSRSGGGGQTSSNEPWKPVQEWLTQQIPIGQQLQDYYQQNPFNPQQQEAYNNIFADQANFRGQIAPGMMDFANRLMGTNYQRAPNMFERGSVNGRTGRQPIAGLLGGGVPQIPQGSASTRPAQYEPTVRQPSGGAFTMPFAGAGGSTNPTGAGIDFNAQNPFYKPPGEEKPPTDEQTIQQLIDEEMRRRDEARQQADYYFSSGN